MDLFTSYFKKGTGTSKTRSQSHQRKLHELLAPAVFIDEVAGALTKAERQKGITLGQAAPLFVKVMNSPRS